MMAQKRHRKKSNGESSSGSDQESLNFGKPAKIEE